MNTEPTDQKADGKAIKTDDTDDKSVFVVDPEDYQKTRRLKEIHQAKKEVQQIRRNRSQIISDISGKFQEPSGKVYQQTLARHVAQYGSELLPLIEKGREIEALSDDDLTCSLGPRYVDIDVRQFTRLDGKIPIDGEIRDSPERNTMEVYRQLNRIMSDLGLGLDLEQEQNREWEI